MDRWFTRLAACLGLGIVFSLAAAAQQSTTGVRGVAQRHTVTNFSELANRQALAPMKVAVPRQARHRPKRRERFAAPELSLPATQSSPESLALASASLASPPPAASFLA